MTWVSGVMVYLVVWWVVLFTVLAVGRATARHASAG